MTRDEIRVALSECNADRQYKSGCTISIRCVGCPYRSALAALERVLALADSYAGVAGRHDDHTYGADEIAAAVRRAVEGE